VAGTDFTSTGGLNLAGSLLETLNAGFGRAALINSQIILHVGGSGTADYDLTADGTGIPNGLYGAMFEPSFRMTANHGEHIALLTRAYSIDDGSPRTVTDQYGHYIAASGKGANTTVTNSYGLFVSAPTAGATNTGIYNAGTLNQIAAATLGATTFTANPVFSVSSSPASNAAGTPGQVTWDASYVYICIASGNWKRAALTGAY